MYTVLVFDDRPHIRIALRELFEFCDEDINVLTQAIKAKYNIDITIPKNKLILFIFILSNFNYATITITFLIISIKTRIIN